MSENIPIYKPEAFKDYTDRASEMIGEIEEGQYGQHRGRLVLRLNEAQFEERYRRYLELGMKYANALESSDTIEDTLTIDIRALEVELLIADSLFLPVPKFLLGM